MQQTATIRHEQCQRNKTEHDGREPQSKPYDKAKGFWTNRGSTTPETTDSKQYMESTGAITSATASTMGYNMMQQPMIQQHIMQPQIMQPQMMQIQQQPQMGMNVMQMPQTQYGAPQHKQQWKMM